MARKQGRKADLNRMMRGRIIRCVMVSVMFSVIMRDGHKEVRKRYGSVRMGAVWSMCVCSSWMQMESRQEQQRREKHDEKPSPPH